MIKPPAMGVLLNDNEITSLTGRYGRLAVKFILNRIIDGMRASHRKKSIQSIRDQLKNGLKRLDDLPLKRVINATGVVLHTNLGRAPISEKMLKNMSKTLCGYINLEYNLKEEKRGKRERHLIDYCSALFGRDYLPILVNNNAASLLLIINTFSNRKETIISRGELVEIGGSFRIPDILKAGGAKLKEIGTTNRTTIKDYESAISEKTGIILKVHQSNFLQTGYVKSSDLSELISISESKNIPVVFDLGGGLLEKETGFSEEETITNALKLRCPIICFSMDKWMGGIQGGMILTVGKYYKRLTENPLIRALRVDKVALLFTISLLRDYLFGRKDDIPLWVLLKEKDENLKPRAEKIIKALRKEFSSLKMDIEKIDSPIGGGSSPMARVVDYAIRIKTENVKGIAQYLRMREVPVVVRVHKNSLYIHMRAIFQREDLELTKALLAAIRLSGFDKSS